MVNVRFEISSDDIKNSLEEIYYSDTLVFHLKKYEGEDLVFDEDTTLVEIKRGRTDLPAVDYDKVAEEFCLFIDSHNENLASHSLDIKFEITDIDSRYACTYKEYLNGNLIKEGVGWAKDIENPVEREAWDDAVIKYKKENNIKMSTDKMKDVIEETNNAVGKLDSELPLEFDLTPPLIETVIPTLATDPCNFANNIIKAAQVSISRINGFPSPVELANYYIKLTKDNIASVSTSVANMQQPIVQMAVTPVIESYDDSYDYFKQLDAEREEYLKTHAEEYYLFKTIDYQEPDYSYLLKTEVLSTNGETIQVNGGNKIEVISQLGFTGSDSKSYCDSKMAWNTVIKTLAGERRITVHKDLVEEVKSIFNEIYNLGFNVKLVGGYTYRTINNPKYPNSTTLSMHSFGCAIDINWKDNPFKASQSRPFEYAPDYWAGIQYNPNECIWTNNHPVVRIFKNHEWGWGGRYGDFMHFSKANGS